MIDGGYLNNLNEAQRAAVEYLGGPQLVIAGAGSGKTRVLTYKIVHLLKNGISPGRILALTFTNKAAAEMRERISSLVGPETASRLWMGTFHSIFARILRYNAERLGFKNNFTIYDAADSKSLIRNIIKELSLDDKLYRPGLIAQEISWAKNQLISPEAYAADKELVEADLRAKRGRLCDIYRIYRDRCRIEGTMDFDDLLFYTNVLLRDNPDILRRYRDYFEYILVDEYQDTNFAQHLIIRQLGSPKNNICVVGDDAQSIYSFRGANIHNILDLDKSFENIRTFKLEQNYRSTGNIIGAANSLILANKEQIAKQVFTTGGDGDKIELSEAFNEYEEANTIASRISRVRRALDLSYKDIAVLYRTNAQSRVLEEALRNRNIPYRIFGGLAFYQRKEIKDAVSYLRLSINPNDDEALARIINVPKRGIGETTLGKLRSAAMDNGASIYSILKNPEAYSLQMNKGTLNKLNTFRQLLDNIVEAAATKSADEAANYIVEQSGLIAEYVAGNTPENISKRENLIELLNGVKTYTDERYAEGETPSLTDYLSEISLMTDQDTSDDGNDSVTLMTIHSAKGLEFGAVFVVGVEERLLPSEKCTANAEIEEERRLLYVAITRAKKFCMLSYASKRMVSGETRNSMRSRFIADISPKYMKGVMGTPLPSSPTPRTTVFANKRPSFIPQTQAEKNPEPIVHKTIGSTSAPASAQTGEFTIHSSSELRQGQRIQHSSFGLGVILTVDKSRPDHRIVVNFSSSGDKTLLLKFARFKLLS